MLIDRDQIHQFLSFLHARAAAALDGTREKGVIQLCTFAPDNGRMVTQAFAFGDVDHMVEVAVIAAGCGSNVYVETRTVRAGRPTERGKSNATLGVFALVIDNDDDMGRGSRVKVEATCTVETSPGNSHAWLFLDRALAPGEAKSIGETIRKATGADHCTGNTVQPYRVAGTPNFPDDKKRARGRVVVPTRLVSTSNRLWSKDELIAVFGGSSSKEPPTNDAPATSLEARRSRPPRKTPVRVKMKVARKATPRMDRSAQFHTCVCAAEAAGMTPDQLEQEMRKHPDGCSSKYLENGDRLRHEIDRSWGKTQRAPTSSKAEEGATILDDVHAFLGRFVAYPSEAARAAHTLWIAHAHLMDAWDSTPRLAFLSPEPASGKTRALEVSELLVPRPVEAIYVTPAYLFRKVGSEDGLPTILFDEVDTVFGPKMGNHEELRGLLNAGHRRGAVAGRCVVYGTTVETEEIPAYCAVALAGLGDLPDTILSRSVIIRMRRRAPSEAVEQFRRRDVAPQGEALRSRLEGWARGVLSQCAAARPKMPNEVRDRDADMWEPLLAVAGMAGGRWPEIAFVTAVTLVTLSQGEGDERSLGIRLLSDLRIVFGEEEAKHTKTLLSKLHQLPEAPWNDLKGKPLDDRGLARRLRAYGIKSKLVRVADVVGRGYGRDDFKDAWDRYLPPPFPRESVTSVTGVTKVGERPPARGHSRLLAGEKQ
jgi:hypothetical protein